MIGDKATCTVTGKSRDIKALLERSSPSDMGGRHRRTEQRSKQNGSFFFGVPVGRANLFLNLVVFAHRYKPIYHRPRRDLKYRLDQ